MIHPIITPRFERYIGIDYSGADVPTKAIPGISVYLAYPGKMPEIVAPLPYGANKWSRQSLFDWLSSELESEIPTLVGIDHGFSFPIAYFQKHRIRRNWTGFLKDFCKHWPTDANQVQQLRKGNKRHGNVCSQVEFPRRLTEQRARAKSVFQFVGQGNVAYSTHAGLPWLLHLRKKFGTRVHFWPFDSWVIPPNHNQSVVAEVYPALWNRSFREDAEGARDGHQRDAYSIAAWMRQMDASGSLTPYFSPQLSPRDRKIATIEGWILGVA
jgi:hypothetical protein